MQFPVEASLLTKLTGTHLLRLCFSLTEHACNTVTLKILSLTA